MNNWKALLTLSNFPAIQSTQLVVTFLGKCTPGYLEGYGGKSMSLLQTFPA